MVIMLKARSLKILFMFKQAEWQAFPFTVQLLLFPDNFRATCVFVNRLALLVEDYIKEGQHQAVYAELQGQLVPC